MVNISKYFFIVLAYNFKNIVKKPFFKITTAVITIIILVGLFLPDIIFKSNIFNKHIRYYFYIIDNDNKIFNDHLGINLYMKEVNDEKERYYFELIAKDVKDDSIQKDLEEGIINGFIKVRSSKKIEIVTSEKIEALQFLIDDYVSEVRLKHISDKYDFDYNVLEQEKNVDYIIKNLDIQNQKLKNILNTYIMPGIIMMFIYICIITFGQFICINVNMEKNSKIIEVLLTKSKPSNIILGKTLGIALAGFIQTIYFILFMFSVVSILSYEKFPVIKSMITFNLVFFINAIVYFVLGIVLYSFLFSIIGNLVKKTEDISIVTIPIMIFLSIASFLSMIIIQFPQSKFLISLTYIPLFTPITSILRFGVGGYLFENLISCFIVVIFIVFLGHINVLMYKRSSLFK